MEIKLQKYLRIKVIPKSRETKIAEIMEDGDGEITIKIRIKAAPEKGKANKELLKFLAHYFDRPVEQFEIISGKTEQLKLIRVQDAALE